MELREAIGQIYQNNAILLLGAGFSSVSLNSNNQNLPTGGQLARILSTDLEIEGSYSLPMIVSTYLNRHGSAPLTKRLREIFSVKTISPDQARIISLPWKRIYTLNYDNVVETICADQGIPLKVIGASDSVRRTEGPTQYVHLHGEVYSGDRSSESLILSTESYNLLEGRSGWFGVFRSDAEIADCVIVVGCSLSDLHLSSFFFRDPALQGKTFFIEYEKLDAVWQSNLALYGSVYPIGLKGFADLISAVGRPPATRREFPISFDLFSLPDSPREPGGTDIFNLVLLGSLDGDILPPVRSEDSRYMIFRDDVDEIFKKIDIGSAYGRYLLHSDLGNGKTTAVHSLCYGLAQRGWTVLTLRQLRDVVSADFLFLRGLTGRVAIVVEDIFRTNNRRDVQALIAEFPRFTYIVTCRTTIYEIQGHELGDIMQGHYEEFDLNYLSDLECRRVVDWFDKNGLWGGEAKLGAAEKSSIIVNRCKREMRSVILDRFKSKFMKDRIDNVFKTIPEGKLKRWLLVVLVVELCGFDPNPRMVRELAGYSPTKFDVEAAGAIREFIDFGGHRIAVRSPVLASVLVSEIYGTDQKVDILVDIAAACVRLSVGHDAYAELLKFTYRPAIMNGLFSRNDYLPAVKRVFDKLKGMPELRRHSLFWLQYAIVLTNEREYFGAKLIFDTAFGQARNSDFDTFQVDNHYARFLLESRAFEPTLFQDYFWAFSEAHKRLRAQIIKERNSTHPYRVAEFYREFLDTLWDRMDPRQRGAVRRMVVEMEGFLEGAPIRYGAQHITESRAALAEWLKSH